MILLTPVSTRNVSRAILAALIVIPLNQIKPATILEDTIEENYAVAPTAKVSIRNDDGSIMIYGAAIAEIKLQATKKAYNSQRLEQISVKVSSRPGEFSIDTRYPPKPKWGWSDRSGTVDYVIVMPWTCDISQLELGNGEVFVDGMRGNNVHVTVGSGRLFGHNCFTDLHAAVASGAMDIAYDWWETRKVALDAQIVNGNVRAILPTEAAFHLNAATVNGQVASDFTEKEHRQPDAVSKIDMVIGGKSETEVKIRAINGSINIAEAIQ
jgi:Putative adhesin